MKVNSIISQLAFRSNNFNEDNVIGYDDEISKSRRGFIREHYDLYRMPYQSIYESEGRLSEYQLNNLIKTLNNKPLTVDYESINGLPVPNIKPIGNNSYRGGTMVDSPKCLKVLKNAGIKRVIDLDGSSRYEEAVKKAGLDYFSFDIKYGDGTSGGFWSGVAFQSKQEYTESVKRYVSLFRLDNANKYLDSKINQFDKKNRIFIENLVNYIRKMQEGYCYIGCEYGTHATDDALLLNNIFNPKAKGEPKIFDLYKIDNLRNLYAKLTENDKKLMGWTKDFDVNFLPKLKNAEKALLKISHL